ncbi:UNVERIFIED_CONTAM: transcriptional regulator swi6 [Siphonaria sp. JEL0065]|nr:transcriptional regulator swi6 [Siphonaria sp. JEL0065]
MDPIILTLGDVSLRASDLYLLNDGQWLNDSLIQFSFETMEYDKRTTCLVSPSVVHLLSHVDQLDFAQAIAEPLKLSKMDIVFLPVNDSEDIEAPGGSHWSLLVFSRPDHSFFYYDSMSKFNLKAAQRVREKFWPLLRRHATEGPAYFQEMDIQRQMNGHDCGVYVISIAEQLLTRLKEVSQTTGKPGDNSMWRMKTTLTPADVSRKRVELKEKIPMDSPVPAVAAAAPGHSSDISPPHVLVPAATTTTTTTDEPDVNDNDSDPTPTNSPLPSSLLPSSASSSASRPHSVVYQAIYSNIPVYEMMYKGIQCMKRISDSWLNATHILKAAGYSKPKRTKILELEVLQLPHEKIQGGYGKYQGTWVSMENGIKLAIKHKVEPILKPLLEFEASNGDVAMSKLNFNAHHGILPPPKPEKTDKGDKAEKMERAPRVSADQSMLNSSQPNSPMSSPAQTRPPRTAINASSSLAQPFNDKDDDDDDDAPLPPPVVTKRPVGRPPRVPRPPSTTNSAPPTPSQSRLAPPKPVVKRQRRVSYDDIDVPTSPPGAEMRMNMELGNAIYLYGGSDDLLEDQTELKLFHDPQYYADQESLRQKRRRFTTTPPTPPPQDFFPSTLTKPQLQREIILSISTSTKTTSEIISLLRDPDYNYTPLDPLVDPTPPPPLIPYVNPNLILDAKQHTPLHWAATYARADLVETLLVYAANPRAINLDSETPLMRAACSNASFQEQNFDFLLKELGPVSARMVDKQSRNLLHKLAIRGSGSGSGNGGGTAAQSYYMKCVAEWIDDGGFLSWLGPKETTSALSSDVYKAKVKSVVAGFVNEQDVNGDTPLHLAVRGRCLEIVSMLVKLGASLETVNEVGERPVDCFDDDDLVMAEALKVEAGRERRRRTNDRFGGFYGDLENHPRDSFELQIEAAKSEVEALHRSQNMLEKIHQRALDLGKKILHRPIGYRPITINKASITLDHHQHNQVSNRFSSASPPTSVTLSSYDDTGYSAKKLPVIELLPLSSMEDVSPIPSDVDESGSPQIVKRTSLHHQQESSPPQISRDVVTPLTFSPIVSTASIDFPEVNSTIADATDTGIITAATTPPQALAPLPTPPTTTRPPAIIHPVQQQQQPQPAPAHVLRRIQDQIAANEKSQKRLFEEIEQVWVKRADKTKRYKKMLAETCGVFVSRVEEDLLSFDGDKI